MSNSLQPHGLYHPWNSPGQNTGVGSLSLLQGIFPTQGLNPGLPHCRQILYQLSHKGNQRILEWVAYPFSNGSSQPRNWTRVFCIAGRFFSNWVIREAPKLKKYLLNGWNKPAPLFYWLGNWDMKQWSSQNHPCSSRQSLNWTQKFFPSVQVSWNHSDLLPHCHCITRRDKASSERLVQSHSLIFYQNWLWFPDSQVKLFPLHPITLKAFCYQPWKRSLKK